jgi:hypothetical protein
MIDGRWKPAVSLSDRLSHAASDFGQSSIGACNTVSILA